MKLEEDLVSKYFCRQENDERDIFFFEYIEKLEGMRGSYKD